jgi:hypothetical protein
MHVNVTQTGMYEWRLVKLPISNFMIIHSAVLERLHVDKHGKAIRHISATSRSKSVNRTGLTNHNKCEAVSVLKCTKILISNEIYWYLFYVPHKVLNQKTSHQTLISGFRRGVDEICGLLGYYTASCGNYLPINNYHTTPCNNPEDHRFHLTKQLYHMDSCSYASFSALKTTATSNKCRNYNLQTNVWISWMWTFKHR